jgi:hypothetical protein
MITITIVLHVSKYQMNRPIKTDEEDKDSIHELPVQLLFEEDQYERATLNSQKKPKKLKFHQR